MTTDNPYRAMVCTVIAEAYETAAIAARGAPSVEMPSGITQLVLHTSAFAYTHEMIREVLSVAEEYDLLHAVDGSFPVPYSEPDLFPSAVLFLIALYFRVLTLNDTAKTGIGVLNAISRVSEAGYRPIG